MIIQVVQIVAVRQKVVFRAIISRFINAGVVAQSIAKTEIVATVTTAQVAVQPVIQL